MTVSVTSAVRISSVTLDSSARREILNSSQVLAALDSKGEQAVEIADGVGSATYAMSKAEAGQTRGHVIVYTPSLHAIRSNAKHGTLARVLAEMRST